MQTTLQTRGSGVSQMVPLASVRTDAATQSRVKINPTTVRSYARDMAWQTRDGGVTFPAIVVFADGSDHWLGDGFHRVLAAREAGLTEILAEVCPGTQRDALLYSISANTAHGLPLTNADKKNAVSLLLADSEWGQWSDREIARRCGVSHRFVKLVRKRASGYGIQMGERKVRRGDTVYEMKASRTGSATAVKASKEEPTAIAPRRPIAAATTDSLGIPLTELTAGVFAGLGDFGAAKEHYAQLVGLLSRIAQSPGGYVYRQRLHREADSSRETFACAELLASHQKLLSAEPYCSYCPYCHLAHPGFAHPDCKTCRGRGWTTQAEFEACPESYRQEILRMRKMGH